MEILSVGLAAFILSGLTLFTGFGLGTLLMPVFALFFPVPTAIAATATVHLLNNLFKLTLFWKQADRRILWQFGLPAIVSAVFGARLLATLAQLPPLAVYRLWGVERAVLPVNAGVAALMIIFALLELLPWFESLSFPARWLPFGGLLSGFFGGLSGHQGAFRSAFLAKCGLSKEKFLGTGIAIAILIDLTRLPIYAVHLRSTGWKGQEPLLLAATVCAFLGAWAGTRGIQKVTMRGIRILMAVLLIGIGLGLASGLIGTP